MSGSYGSLNSKYNTLYALYLQLQSDISGASYTLQEVLDAGNTANDIPIQLLSSDDRFEGNYTSTSLNFVDNLNPNTTTLNNGGLSFTNGTTTIQNNLNGYSSVNTSTGEVYSLASNGLIVAGASGQQNLFNGDVGFIQIQQPDAKYLALSPNYININGSQGSEGQVLSKDITTNFPIWADLPVSEIPDLSGVLNAGAIASKSIDMNGFDISGVSTIIADPIETDMSGQFTFNLPPHIPDPILGNDAAPKGYVDSLVGQYAGGFNLFFNYSQPYPYPSFQKLSQVISTSTGEIVPTTLTNGNNFIAQFMSNSLGIETIPVGLWDAFVYGAINNIGADTHYYFELWKKDVLDVDTLLGTSGISPDVNASPNNNPTSYSMVLAISTEIPLELTDRLYIIIYASYNGSGTRQLSTYFEGNYYSFVQTSLNAGTTLLSSNNTWTGTNDFLLPPTTPNQVGTPANTDIVNYGTIDTLISDSLIPIVSTLDYYITTDSPFFQYPPSPPTNALLQAYQYYGWYFINSVALRKIDWFFAPDYAMTVGDVLGVYLNYFNVTTTSNDNLPFFTIYTKPTGSGDYYPLFAHSSATYTANFTPTAATPFCSFMNISGTQPDPFPYGHQLGAMILSPVAPNPRGEYLPTEEVLAISIGTNSTSPVNQVNFIMSKVGICLAQGNQELILNPQNIIAPSVPTLSQVLTSNNTATAQDVVLTNTATTNTLRSTGITIQNNIDANVKGIFESTNYSLQNGLKYMFGNANDGLSLYDVNTGGFTTYNKESIITNASVPTFDISVNALTLSGVASTTGQVLTANASGKPIWSSPTSSWVGTATSQLNMGIYDISGAVLDNSGGTLAVGGNTTTTTIGKATTGITNLQGVVKINNSAGTSGQVLTSTGASTAPTWQTSSSGWVGTATSQLNMGIYDISGAVLDNSGGTLSVGANTTTTTIGKATTGITNIQGNLQIAGSAGSNAQVLTSNGTTASWQTPSSGSALPIFSQRVVYTQSLPAAPTRAPWDSIDLFLNVNCPSTTASYLITGGLGINTGGAISSTTIYINIGVKAGGGAQGIANTINIANGLLMNNATNAAFSRTNSVSQGSISTTNPYLTLPFSIIYTPASIGLFSYAIWYYTAGGGGGALYNIVVQQITA